MAEDVSDQQPVGGELADVALYERMRVFGQILSDVSRRNRRSLLSVVTITLALSLGSFTGLLSFRDISLFGVALSDVKPQYAYSLLVLIKAYLLVVFMVGAWRDKLRHSAEQSIQHSKGVDSVRDILNLHFGPYNPPTQTVSKVSVDVMKVLIDSKYLSRTAEMRLQQVQWYIDFHFPLALSAVCLLVLGLNIIFGDWRSMLLWYCF